MRSGLVLLWAENQHNNENNISLFIFFILKFGFQPLFSFFLVVLTPTDTGEVIKVDNDITASSSSVWN